MTDPRATRLAENEARFRDINERMREGLRPVARPDEQLPFICECGAAECKDTVALTPTEYERVRADPRDFAIVPGHDVPEVEDVIGGEDQRYAIVRKKPPGDRIAQETDPRSS
jgi:hypothetical protein